MTEALPWVSMALSLVVMLVGALGRETVGELKRRVAELERRGEARDREVAQLDERSRGMTASLQRIEEQMVPRSEWETRHAATDATLQRILDALSERGSSPHLDQPPPMPRRPR